MQLLGVLALLYGAALVLASIGYRRLLYPAPPGGREPSVAGATVERFAGPDGALIALHLPAPAGAATVVHFHGNGEELADQGALALRYAAAGLGFYAVEYPGYGQCRGIATTEATIFAAAEAALAHLAGLGVARERMVLEGQSLGSGVAVEMAARGWGSRVILIAPYTSIVAVASRLVPVLPASLYVRDRFDSAAKAPRVRVPVLIVHGTRDQLIPVSMGRELRGLLGDAVVEEVEGAEHNDVFAGPWAPRVLARMTSFARGER